MYESPVELKFNEIKTELIKKENEMLIRAVQEVVPNVTEEELVKALSYDRHQYEKGFWDGREARDAEIVRCKDCDHWNTWDAAGKSSLGNFVCSCAYWTSEDGPVHYTSPSDFCSFGERREDGEGN